MLLTEDPLRPGTYVVGPVEPGPFDLIAECPGYKPLKRPFNVPESVAVDVKGAVGRFSIASLDWEVEMEPLATDGR